MSSTEPDDRELPLAVRIAWLAARDYAVTMTGPILVISVLIRAIALTTFFTLLGHHVNGEQGRHYAFVGAVAFAAVTPTVIKITDILADERLHGTMYRLRLTRIPILAIMIVRSWVYFAEGLVAAATAIVLAGPLLVGTEQARQTLLTLPILATTAASCLGLGLFAATLAVDRRITHLLANGLAYLILLTSGAIVPLGRHLLLDTIGRFLPLRHGLTAIRTEQDIFLLHEVFVGAGWFALAGLVLAIQSHRARRHGLDNQS